MATLFGVFQKPCCHEKKLQRRLGKSRRRLVKKNWEPRRAHVLWCTAACVMRGDNATHLLLSHKMGVVELQASSLFLPGRFVQHTTTTTKSSIGMTMPHPPPRKTTSGTYHQARVERPPQPTKKQKVNKNNRAEQNRTVSQSVSCTRRWATKRKQIRTHALAGPGNKHNPAELAQKI